MSNKDYEQQVAGLTYNGAPGHVFQYRHVREDLAWDRERNLWVGYDRATVFTWGKAVSVSVHDTLPVDGRWYAIGKHIYSVE